MSFTEGPYVSGSKGRYPFFGVQSKQLGQQVQRVRVGDLLALQVFFEPVLLVPVVKHVEAAPHRHCIRHLNKRQIHVDGIAAKHGLGSFVSVAFVLRPRHTDCSTDSMSFCCHAPLKRIQVAISTSCYYTRLSCGNLVTRFDSSSAVAQVHD